MSHEDAYGRNNFMTQILSSTIKGKNKLWAAVGGPLGLWSTFGKVGSELAWVFAGKFALMGANAAVMLFLAKRLDFQTYGLLVITISAQLLISRFLMIGVDTGMVRLAGLSELRSRSQEVVTAGLVVMVYSSSVLLGISLLAIPVLSSFGVPGWAIACIVIGTIGTAFVDYGYGFRLAHHQYPLAALAQGGTAVWRLAATAVAALSIIAHPILPFFAYHGASLFSGVLQTLIIAKNNWRRPDRSLVRRLLRYSFWQGKANVVIILNLYQGTFLLILLRDPATTGIFGLALTLSLGFFAIYNAYSEYLLVRIRSVERIRNLSYFVRHSLMAALMLILACVPVVFVLAKLLPWFLGPEWSEVVPIFVYLAAAMGLLILQAPLEATCHYLLKPHLIVIGWVTRVILIGIAGFVLIPTLGATGAAIAQVLGSAVALLVFSYLVAATLRTAEAVEVSGDS